MQPLTVFTIKIKIISLHFQIRAVQGSIQFSLLKDNRTVDTHCIKLKHGLLQDNITLACQVTSREISQLQQLRVVMMERSRRYDEPVGNISIKFQQFKETKLKKFHIENCFDSSAYMQAFLLMLPTRIIDEAELPILSEVSLKPVQSMRDRLESKLNSARELSIEENQHNEMTFDARDTHRGYFFNEAASEQTINVESLVTLNQILQEANKELQTENNQLKVQLQVMEGLMKQWNVGKTKLIELQSQYEATLSELTAKETEITIKNQQIQTFEQKYEFILSKYDSLSQQMMLLREKKEESVEEFKIKDLIALSPEKSIATVRRVKTKYGHENHKIEWKLTSIPKIKSQKLDFLPKEGSKSYRAWAQQPKVTSKRQKKIKNDETFDTLMEKSLTSK